MCLSLLDDDGIKVPANPDAQYDATDRMIHQPYFDLIQSKTMTFTLDACSDKDGTNALTKLYCSHDNDFLTYDCSGHHVWINPPFKNAFMRAALRHYLMCKRKAPTSTSACIMLPVWAIPSLSSLLQGMQLIHCFPKYMPVMTVPSPTLQGPRFMFNEGLPFDLHVYYDPPEQKPISSIPIQSSTKTSEHLTLMSKCLVSGVETNINIGGPLPGILAIDTLASRNFIDRSFIQQLPVRIKKHPSWLSNVITLGDNTTRKSYGVVHIHIKIQSYTDTIWCEVFDLPADFSMILGQQWLDSNKCLIDYATKTCTLRSHNRRYTLQCGPQTSKANLSSNFSPTLQAMTALQAKRLFRKQSAILPEQCKLIVVRASTTEPSSQDDQPQIQELCQQYAQVFSSPPPGLPPQREIVHAINLLPGSSPPFKPIYRLSMKEKKETDTTIKELLEKQLIQPSTSPFGAPILFVGMKDGSLRMCVDYRALNKLTIKNRYPLPRIDDLLDHLHGARYFTTLDLASGYHQIRIHDPDVPKTAFRTSLGHFEWKVMPFGLCNAPATFQNAMNCLFGHRIGLFVLVYMDDILIYSKSKEEHTQHLHEVLSLLQQHEYHVKISKCHFYQTKVSFLGHLISQDGLQVDPAKIETVKKWHPPTDKTGVRSLLGFGNYFRRFIYGYSQIVLPLLELTKKNTPMTWTVECQQAFENLRDAIINAPVLKHPDMSQPFQLICDASNYASGAILLQDNHPCAFASKKFLPAECNYTTEERELLAVIHALKLFRCYLEGNHFTIITDHHPLKFFDTKQDLSPRQARWSQYLSRFDYSWEWIKGKTNPADFLSRNPPFASLLLPMVTRTQTGKLPKPIEPYVPKRISKTKRKHKYSVEHQPPPPNTDTTVNDASPSTSTLPPQITGYESNIDINLIKQGYQHDSWFQDDINTSKLHYQNNLYWHHHAIAVPKYLNLRKWIIQEFHDTNYSGHFGVHKTLQTIQRSYWWPFIRKHVKDYIQTCHTCQRNKALTSKTAGLLKPLPIPLRPWSDISMDLITGLPITTEGYDALVVVVDRLTKMTHFFPCNTTVTATQLARLFLDNIFRLHGIPSSIVSDRDRKFTCAFWQELCKLLGTKQNLSTPYHPETDGQTERMNRVIEEMLRHYIAPHQRDWNLHLSTCEFAINNATQESTGYSPFYLTYGYHPLTPASVYTLSKVPAANELHTQLCNDLKQAKLHLEAAQTRQKYYHDSTRRVLEFAEGDRVLLSTKHVGLYCTGSPKLLPRYIGPFKVLKRIGELAYRLELPPVMKIHNVFHVTRLRRFYDDGRIQPPPLPTVVDGELEYEVEKIYAHRDVRVGKSIRREFLVRWKGYDVEHDEYVPEANLGNALGKLREYWESRKC